MNSNLLHALAGTLTLCALATLAQAAETPVSKIEIVQPTEGQMLQGTVEVRVKITPPEGRPMPQQVYAGLGGPPWVKMQQSPAANEWVAQMDSTLVPNGEQTLRITTDERRAKATQRITVENPLKCYFGDLHSHSGYSDGTVLPEVAHDYARNVAKLDFFALTDHLEAVDAEEWNDIREQAWKANQDGVFVALPGLEWSKREGHACIFDPLTAKWPRDIEGFYRAAAEAGAVVKFNHPGEGTNVFNGLAYSAEGDRAVQLMEVRRETEEKAYLRALKQGWHVAPDGSDDTHSANWGNNRTWTGIWSPGLSQRNVWAALKGRHCFSTQDRNCQLFFSVNGAVMGEMLTEPVKTVEILVRAKDPDPTDKCDKIELYEDGQIVLTQSATETTVEWKPNRQPPPGPHYYFVKVVQADGNTMWSAPVWVIVSEG